MDSFQFVVGSKECPINTIGLIIQSSLLITNEWSSLARGLAIGNEHVRMLRDDRLLNKINNKDIIWEVLELWVGENGSSATLGKLLNVVEEQCGANDAGESLRLYFRLPCKEADGNPSIDWKDISSAFQNLIIKSFQKFFPNLKFSETLPNMKGPSLIKLMTGEKPPLYVHPFPDKLCYYINRVLITRNIISKKIFEQNSQDIFLFTGMDISELSALTGNMLTGTSSEQLQGSFTVKFIILDRAHHFETICEKTKHPVHLLRREGDGRLRWISSKGRMDNLRKYVDQLQDEFDEAAFCRHLDSQVMSVLICDSPGMGKSVLLAQIGTTLSQLYPDRIVLFIVFTEFMKLIKSFEMEDDVRRIEIALQKLTGEPILHFNINLKETAFSFELLLDGFDELDSGDYKLAHVVLFKISTSFKSIRLWVTSRPHLMEELETNLNLLGHNIRPFKELDQIKFLSSFWSRKERLYKEKSELFALNCLKSLKSKMDSRSQDIAGIPLQCLLIGEVYEKDALEYARLDNTNGPPIGIEIGTITNLYRGLIRKKIEKYESLNDKLCEDELMVIHAQLGIELLFPAKTEILKLGPIPDESGIAELLKVGIIVKSSSMESSCAFLHRTFAEYFVAWFVVDKLRREGKWTEEINYFFLYCILDIGRYGYFESFEGNYIFESPKFSEPVICYFINSFIADLRAGNYSPLCTQLNRESAELMNTIAHACANDNLVHIFNLFYELYEFDETYTRTIFTEDFLLLSIEYSSLELVKPIVSQLEQDDKFCMELQAEALRNAVRLGKFSIVEFLIKEKQLCGIVKDLSYGTWRLMHDCIKESVKCSDEEIENKIQVLRMLIRINASLLDSKVDGRGPLLFDNVHVKLLIELVRLGADVLAEDEHRTVLHLSHHKTLSSSDYHSLIMSIPDKALRNLVHRKEKEQGHTPLTSALKWIDPTPETLDIFRRVGADFNHIIYMESSMLEFAIMNGRSAVTIRKIIQHGDVKALEQTKTVPNMRLLPPYHCTNMLHIAADWGNVEVVGMLMDEYGIDVNSKDERGLTPLDIAIKSNSNGDRFNTGLAIKERGGRFKDDNSLIIAAVNRNIQSVRLLISFGVDVNGRDEQGNTALHKCLKLKVKIAYIVQVLLDNGADPTASNKMGETAFHTAIKNKNLDSKIFLLLKSKTDEISSWTPSLCNLALQFAIQRYYALDEEEFISILNKFSKICQVNVCLSEDDGNFAIHVTVAQRHHKGLQLLLDKGAELNVKNNLEETPLHVAVSKGYFEFVQLLAEKGADPNVKNNLGETPLHVAVSKGYLKFQRFLVEKGVDLNVKNNLGETPLHVAVSKGYLKSQLFLAEKETDVNLKNNLGETPLHVAVSKGYLICLQLFVEKGADLNVKNNLGETPLHVAVSKGYLECLQLLTDEGAELNAKNNLGETPLNVAVTKGDLECLWLLENKGADLNVKNNLGETPLHAAVSKGYLDFSQLLVEKRADLNVKNNLGETPLHIAVSKGYLDFPELLVEKGADLTVKNNLGETPLHVAVTLGYLDFSQLVVEKEADLNVKNNLGETPLHVAVSKGYLKFVQLLLEKGANLNPKNNLGETPLHVAVAKGQLECLWVLENKGADLNVKNNLGETPLHVAVSKGYLDFPELLVEKGADLNVKNNLGETPLHVAVNKGYLEFAQLLVENGADLTVENNLGETNLDRLLFTWLLVKNQRGT